MTTYSVLALIAAKWMTLYFFVVFVAVVLWVFRPGSTKFYESARTIPLRHEDKPAPDRAGRSEEA